MTTTRADTAHLPRGERAAFVKETLRANVLPLEVQHHDSDVALALVRTDLADISLQSLASSDTTFWRTATQARDDAPPTVYLALKRRGRGQVSQDGRQAVVRPGDLVLTRSTGAATVDMAGGSAYHHLLLPFGQLALPERTVRRVTAVPLRPDRPLARVVASHVRQLAASAPLDPHEAMALARPTVALVRALVAVAAEEPHLARGPLGDTLQHRVVDYLHEHWLDRDLTVAVIARAHHVSTRHVYHLLASSGISLRDWLRTRRLEACRDQLAGPDAWSLRVSDVGKRFGFHDATSFGRAFRRAYGMTPGDWRAAHAPARGRGHQPQTPHLRLHGSTTTRRT